ncbi:hypothetical protein NL676_012607 [Syzygium grande]|nr:hypothetical protein NL676_012607 [Syzygium grande]
MSTDSDNNPEVRFGVITPTITAGTFGMNSLHTSLVKLDGTNYPSWSMALSTFIYANRQSRWLEEEPPENPTELNEWRVTDAALRTLLWGSMTDSVRHLFMDCMTARECYGGSWKSTGLVDVEVGTLLLIVVVVEEFQVEVFLVVVVLLISEEVVEVVSALIVSFLDIQLTTVMIFIQSCGVYMLLLILRRGLLPRYHDLIKDRKTGRRIGGGREAGGLYLPDSEIIAAIAIARKKVVDDVYRSPSASRLLVLHHILTTSGLYTWFAGFGIKTLHDWMPHHLLKHQIRFYYTSSNRFSYCSSY